MDKVGLLLSEAVNFLGRHAAVLSGGADDSLVLVTHHDSDESVRLERCEVADYLPDAHLEELREIRVRRITAPLVVEAVYFHEEHLLHRAEMLTQPDVSRDPDAFEIPFMSFHSCIVSYSAGFLKCACGEMLMAEKFRGDVSRTVKDAGNLDSFFGAAIENHVAPDGDDPQVCSDLLNPLPHVRLCGKLQKGSVKMVQQPIRSGRIVRSDVGPNLRRICQGRRCAVNPCHGDYALAFRTASKARPFPLVSSTFHSALSPRFNSSIPTITFTRISAKCA